MRDDGFTEFVESLVDARPVGELGDGGVTRWTARLMEDAKERCLVSCIATERLTVLTTG